MSVRNFDRESYERTTGNRIVGRQSHNGSGRFCFADRQEPQGAGHRALRGTGLKVVQQVKDLQPDVGGAGTTAGTNFIGTSDNNDVVFKRNGVQAGLLNNALNNTSWGVNALNPAAAGSNNVAIGVEALYVNTSGGNNIAIGTYSLQANTTSSGNIAIGSGSLFSQSYNSGTSTYNIAIGNDALYNNNPTSTTKVIRILP